MAINYVVSIVLSSIMGYVIVDSGEPVLLGFGSGIIIFAVLMQLAEIKDELKYEWQNWSI